MAIKGILRKTPFHLALIALLGLLAYSNTFDVPFQWDETEFIKKNPIVKDLSYFIRPSTAKGLSLPGGADVFGILKNRYIGYLTFALNYKIHGLDVRGYHIFNLAVHILNAMFVYFLVLLTFRTPFLTPPPLPSPLRGEGEGGGAYRTNLIALFSALLFVSHPIQTEAVTYIFQRLASLAAFFYLLSLVLYIKWRLSSLGHSGLSGIFLRKDSRQAGITARQSIFYLLSLLSAVLAMKTKENAFTLPVMIALYEFMFFRGHGPLRISLKRRLLPLIPFLLTMLIIPLTLTRTSAISDGTTSGIGFFRRGYEEIPRWDYLLTQFKVVVTYIRLLFFPINQNLDYDYPIYHSFFTPQVFLSFLLLLSIFGLSIYFLLRKTPDLRIAVFGIWWFFDDVPVSC